MPSEKPQNSAISLATALDPQLERKLSSGSLSFRQGGRNIVIAVETGNLLCQISQCGTDPDGRSVQ